MKFLQKARSVLIARYVGVGFLLFPFLTAPAFAQPSGSSIATVTSNLDGNTVYLPETLELISYLLGLFCLFSAIMALKEFSQEPEKKPFKPALIRFIVAGMLIALPQTVKTTIKTIGSSPTGMPGSMSRPSLIQGLN
jgi:hypothetical protein